MELELIFFNNENISEEKDTENSDTGHILDNWCRTSSKYSFYNGMRVASRSFSTSIFLSTGIHVVNGRVQNPDEIIDVHKLNSEFVTYKYIRTKFFESQLFS